MKQQLSSSQPTNAIFLVLHGEVHDLEAVSPELVAKEEVGEVDLKIWQTKCNQKTKSYLTTKTQ